MTQALLLFAWYPLAAGAAVLDFRLHNRGVLSRGEKLPVLVFMVLFVPVVIAAHAAQAPELATAIVAAPLVWALVLLAFALARPARSY